MSFGTSSQPPNGARASVDEERPESGQQSLSGRGNRSKTNGGRLQLRSACDACHQSKIKCPGGNPCFNCYSSQNRCNYTLASRIGRPKGSKNKRTLMQQKPDSQAVQQLSQAGNATQEHTTPATARSEDVVMQWADYGQQQQQNQQHHQMLSHATLDQIHFGSDFDHAFDTTTVSGDMGDDSPFRDSNRDLMDMLDPSLLLDSMTDDTSSLSHSMHSLHGQVSMSSASTTLPGLPHESATTGQDPFHSFPMLGSPQLSAKRDSSFALSSDSGTAGTSNAACTSLPASSPHGTSATFSTAPSSNPGSKAATGPHSITTTFSSTSLASASSETRLGPDCMCLPRLIKLICRLENLRHITGSSVDSILHGVQLAEASWKGLMYCTGAVSTQGRTDDSNHKQALLLFATSIRILLSFVQRFNSTINHKFDHSPTDDATATVHLHGLDFHSGNGTTEDVNVCVSVGGVELKGEARAEIIEVSVRRALRIITTALVHLWERTGRPSTAAPSPAFPFPTFAGGNGGSRTDVVKGGPNTPQSHNPPTAGFAAGANANSSGHTTPSSRGEKSESISSLLNTLQYTMKILEEGDAAW